jgi:hypothetical protein
MFFTTNVDPNSGVVASSGFTASNTYEIQVLDGFSFSQNTTADVVTLNEAGAAPVRGQRSFNTSLEPVDFSFSTYVRPADSSTTSGGFNSGVLTIAAPTAVSANVANVTSTLSVRNSTGTTSTATRVINYTLSRAGTTGAASSTASQMMITTGPTVVVKAVTTGALPATFPTLTATTTNIPSATYQWQAQVNATGPFTNITGATSNTYTINSLQADYTAGVGTGNTTMAYRCVVTGTVNGVAAQTVQDDITVPVVQTVTSAGAIVIATGSLNRTLKAANGAAFTDVDFSTGDASISVYEGASLLSYDGAGTAATNSTFRVSSTATAATINTNPSVVTAEEAVLWNALVTSGNIYGTQSAWTESVLNAKLVCDYSQVHQLQKFGVIIVIDTASYIIDNCALDSATIDFGLDAIATIAWAGKGTRLRQVTGLTASTGITVNFSNGLSGTAKGKNVLAPYIANKLSTMSLKGGINGSGTSYTVALTGGQIVFSNNLTYLVPANLGIVNQPITYFTGTRSITGTLNAYLRTGTVAVPNSTATLLSDMLTQSVTDVNPAYETIIAIGGSTNPIRMELDVSAGVLTIPSIATEQVISTTINFTAQGYTTSNTFDITQSNELEVRYYTVL